MLKEYEILRKTLDTYFPKSNINNKEVKVLDAMCGPCFYFHIVRDFINDISKCIEFLCVEKDKDNAPFKFVLEDYTKEHPNFRFKLIGVENLDTNKYENYFDVIFNFRPGCFIKTYTDLIKPYIRINHMLKESGVFFATTYNAYEAKCLYDLLWGIFDNVKTEKNKHDLAEKYYGYVIIAKK